MTDLSLVLGGLLASVARARHIADLETAAIAERYRADPLLEGLSVPRVRLPELCIELPLVLEGHAEGSPSRLEDPKHIAREAANAVVEELANSGVELPQDIRNRLLTRLRAGLNKAAAAAGSAATKESLARRAETVTHEVLTSSAIAQELGPDTVRAALDAARRRVDETAETAPGRPPALQVNVLSGEIKERAAPASVARLSVTLREEGLEWDVARIDDGRIRRRLGPE